MASAVDSRLAYARLSAVATASRLPTANRGSNNSYTTSWDTTVNGLPDLGNFHTYRLESPANSAAFAFFVDGVQQFAGTGVAAAASFNGFEWGDGASAPGNGADVDWDFVYFREVPAIPIPGSLVMMCLGLLGFLSLYRRRAQRA